MQPSLRAILFLFLLLIPALAFAGPGAIETSQKKLVDNVRSRHEIREILERTAQIRTYPDWPADMNPELKLYIAIQWLQKKQSREALQVLASLENANIDPDLRHYYLATALIDLGYTEQADVLLAELEKKFPQDPDYLFLKSAAYAQQEKYVEAIAALTQVIKARGKEGRAYLQRGLLYIYSLSNELAYKDLKKAIRLLPADDVHHRQMAYLQAALIEYKHFNNRKKAQKTLAAGIELDPDSSLVQDLKQKIDPL